ncbi:MAG: restriction endonuclease subunit S [Chloroflexi bacterium]|nr:restriction endonuclease subunit S [Chloroflexota bacterium]
MADPASSELFTRRGWRTVPFGEFVTAVNERVEPSEAADEIYVGLEHLDPQDLHIRWWGKGSDVIGTKLRFRKGDLIFGRRRAYQRKLAVAEFDGICSAHAMVVRARPDMVLPEFLPFLMMSDHFMNRAVEISVGSLSPTINWTTLKLQEFALPPLDQQRRIAEMLWAVDEGLQRWRSVEQDLRQLRLSYAVESYGLHNSFRHGGKAQGLLSDLAEVNPPLDTRLHHDTQVSFVAMADVSEDGAIVNRQTRSYEEVRNGYTAFRERDILFAKITPCMENGKGALATGLVNGVGFGSTEFHVLRPRLPDDADFIYHLTMTRQFRVAARRYMRGSAGQQRVPADFLLNYALEIPDPKRRQEIGAALTHMTRRIGELAIMCQAVACAGSALLGALFGG